MDERFFPLWQYIEEKDVHSLNKEAFENFLKDKEVSFFRDLDALKDEDLFCLLFVELLEKIKNCDKDRSLPKGDQLFDILMQLADYYGPVQSLFLKIENNILTSPPLLKTFLFYKNKISKHISDDLNIQDITVNISTIPYLNSYLSTTSFSVPDCLKEIGLSLILLSFLKIWMKDESLDFENTMKDFQNVLTSLTFS